MTALESIVTSLPPLESRALNSLHADVAKQAKLGDTALPAALAQRCCTAQLATPAPPGAFVDALTDGMKQYQEKQYGGTKSTTARFQCETNEEGHLVLRTYAELIDTHKSRTGYWSGCWVIENEANIKGTISVHVYNYEEGNMQMRAQRDVPSKVIASAEEAVKAIKHADNSLLSDLTDQDVLLNSLKKIRRILPITKTRMKWSDEAHSAVKLLNARSTGKFGVNPKK